MAVYSRKGQFESINIKFKVKKRDFSMHARVFICSQITSTCLIPVYRRKASWLQTVIKLIIALVKQTPDPGFFLGHVGSDGRSSEATTTTSTCASPSSTTWVVVTVGTSGTAMGGDLIAFHSFQIDRKLYQTFRRSVYSKGKRNLHAI